MASTFIIIFISHKLAQYLSVRYELGKTKGYDYGTFEVADEKTGDLEYLAHHYTKQEFTQLLQNAGFKIENYLIHPVKTRSGSTINGHTIIARKIAANG